MMPSSVTPEPLAPDVAARLTDLARTLKAAARAASLYPPTHPAIHTSTDRLLGAATDACGGAPLAITVRPDNLLVDGRAVARPESAIAEMAALLHGHLVGELRVDPQASVAEWQTLLRLLGRSIEDVRAEGGMARTLTTSGAHHLQVREIDYAEVLRERRGGLDAGWDAILANCLDGDHGDLDEPTLRSLLDLVDDADRFGDLVARLQERATSGGRGVTAQSAALLRMLRGMVDLLAQDDPGRVDRVLGRVATATARLSPELMLALIGQARGEGAEANVAGGIVSRISDAAVARFVAQAVATERAATVPATSPQRSAAVSMRSRSSSSC